MEVTFMTYIEKEKAIIDKMKETGFALFDGDEEEAYDTVSQSLDSFTNYANTVIRQQTMLPIYYARYDGEELRDKVTNLDTRRRYAHDNAIGNLNMLNRISDRLGLEPFADIDTSDRYKVADFIGKFVNETYNNGIGRTFDEAVLERTMDYPTDHNQRIRELDEKFGNVVKQAETEEPEY